MGTDEPAAGSGPEMQASWQSGAESVEARRYAPSAARNVGPITERLAERLPQTGRALEIASGTGQHVVACAERFPGIAWTPSDPEPGARASIAAWIEASGLSNLAQPLGLDVTEPGWEQAVTPELDAVVVVNLLHISPWAATEGLFAGAGRLLRRGGRLFVYGCFRRNGEHTAPSNAAFDESLKASDPGWGVRDVDEVTAAARPCGLRLGEVIDMPANNFMLVLERVAAGS